jgi:glycosyltransferase involved in cell wall biosynthesis
MGGLTTHTLNVEKVLKELGITYELFHWKNYREIMNYPKDKLQKYDYILNIHSGFHMHMPGAAHAKVINFVCGAEILFYSPNFFKHIVKQALKGKSLRRVEDAFANIFISNFTFQTMQRKGLRPDYSRDLIFHMCVELGQHKYVAKDLNDETLRFICVARDVPHKNFAGVIKLCEHVRTVSGRKVELVTITNREFHSETISIKSYTNASNELRDELLAKSHFNLLLSLDHSHRGFFEGFGQIVQEAGAFATPSVVLATGGLPESVHHEETGWVLPDLEASLDLWWKKMNAETYRKISDQCYRHTLESHGLDNWKRLFGRLIHENSRSL